MFKSFTITKKGHGAIEFRMYEAEGIYTMVINKVEVRLFDRDHCVKSYKSYLADGWTVKPAKKVKAKTAEVKEEPKEEKAAAPKRTKWDWSEVEGGFTYEGYIEKAKEMNAGYSFRRGGKEMFHVYKSCRDNIYTAMGAKRVEVR